MENLKLTRVDFRLIHGQVMTRWAKKYDTKAVVVIDDRSASNMLLKKILLGAAPAGINVWVESVESAAAKWKDGQFPTESLIVLFKDTDTALRAYQAGVTYPSLQIGGIEGSGDKKNVYKNVVMSDAEAAQLRELGDAGVNVFFQPIPEDAEYSLEDALKKF